MLVPILFDKLNSTSGQVEGSSWSSYSRLVSGSSFRLSVTAGVRLYSNQYAPPSVRRIGGRSSLFMTLLEGGVARTRFQGSVSARTTTRGAPAEWAYRKNWKTQTDGRGYKSKLGVLTLDPTASHVDLVEAIQGPILDKRNVLKVIPFISTGGVFLLKKKLLTSMNLVWREPPKLIRSEKD